MALAAKVLALVAVLTTTLIQSNVEAFVPIVSKSSTSITLNKPMVLIASSKMNRHVSKRNNKINDDDESEKVYRSIERRNFLNLSMIFSMLAAPEIVSASGGATAGKYTTIPIAKRRYYGRVQQGVHEFLGMGSDVINADMTAQSIQHFFDVEGVVVVPAKRKDINGRCTKKNNDCRGMEIRDSRYNDMKTTMYLLGNAFRINQQKAPDNLPTVRAAKAFFKEMDAMEKAVIKKPKTKDMKAVGHYVAALDILDQYLDLVELPPTDSGHYDQEFDTLVGEAARIM